jgi:hypothetical protein
MTWQQQQHISNTRMNPVKLMLVAHYSVTQQTMQMVIKLTVSIQFGEIPMLSTHHRKDMLSFVKKKNYEN